MQIDIDFDVFKALTARRASEAHSYNDVLREVLGLEPANRPDAIEGGESEAAREGRLLGGRFLPNGTRLRATYKHQSYEAHIVGRKLVDEKGRTHSSASAAARAITNTTVNGLTFWEVKRPSDTTWQKLVALPRVSE